MLMVSKTKSNLRVRRLLQNVAIINSMWNRTNPHIMTWHSQRIIITRDASVPLNASWKRTSRQASSFCTADHSASIPRRSGFSPHSGIPSVT